MRMKKKSTESFRIDNVTRYQWAKIKELEVRLARVAIKRRLPGGRGRLPRITINEQSNAFGGQRNNISGN